MTSLLSPSGERGVVDARGGPGQRLLRDGLQLLGRRPRAHEERGQARVLLQRAALLKTASSAHRDQRAGVPALDQGFMVKDRVVLQKLLRNVAKFGRRYRNRFYPFPDTDGG